MDANQFRSLDFAVHAGVLAPKFTGAYYGDTNLLGFPSRRAHSLFIPPDVARGSTGAAGGNA
jgi:hypothetical protein